MWKVHTPQSDESLPVHSTYAAFHEEEDVLTSEYLDYLVT